MPAVCELVCICGPSQPRKHPEGKAKQSGVSWSGPDVHKAVTLHGGVHVRQTRSPHFGWTPGSLTAEGLSTGLWFRGLLRKPGCGDLWAVWVKHSTPVTP